MVEVYAFTPIREEILKRKNKLTLEDIIRVDMMGCGYNPTSKKDIKQFWTDLLEG
jgi:hypothetical protein